MRTFLFKRILQMIPVIMLVSVLAFMISYLAPGDPMDSYRLGDMSEEKIEELDSLMAKHASEYGRLQELIEEKANVEEELAFKYERWEYLNELAAQIEEIKFTFLDKILFK